MTGVHHVAVKCALPACARTPFVTVFQRNDDPNGLPWLHDRTAPWGHGHIEDGIASWYDLPDDPALIRSRSHVTDHGTVVVLCRVCGDRFEISVKNMARAIDSVAATGRRDVTISGLRAVVQALGSGDRGGR